MFDLVMVDVVVDIGLLICLMYVQGDFKIMQDDFVYDDVLLDVYDFLVEWIVVVEVVGVLCDQIIVDLGIGFGKILDYNLVLLVWLLFFYVLGCFILFGVLRKCFIGVIFGVQEVVDRMLGLVFVVLDVWCQGVQIICVYDILLIKQVFSLIQVINEGQNEL